MRHPVQERVRAIQRRAWRLRAVCAGGLWLSGVLGAVFLAGLADYCLRLDDTGVRLLSSAAVLAVCGWCLWRVVVPVVMRRLSEVEVAQRIEQRFPQLCDRLSSAVAFLGQAEQQPTAGSPELRRAVVAMAVADLDRWDFAECLDTRRPRRIAIGAVLVCAAVAFVAAWDWPSASLALRRLAVPWDVDPWPRRNQLQFVKSPTRLAFGSDFEAELVDREGRLPESVQIQIWFDGDETRQIQTKDMKFLQDRMVYRLDNVHRPFRYRAVGGDDDTMPWRTLELVEPPQVTALQIRLHPPAYTGWTSVASGENIRALEGTRIEVAGRISRSAAAVRLRTDKDKPGAAAVAMGRLSEEGLRFTIGTDPQRPWTVTQSVTYWLEVTDAEGLLGGEDRRWNLHAVPDTPPTVLLEQPAANTFVTADAAVPLAGLVKDDLAIRAIAVRFTRSDSADSEKRETAPIYRGPNVAVASSNGVAEAGPGSGETRPVEFAWDLAQLRGLKPGAWIDFELTADDYKPQSAQSTTRRLTIISVNELEERIASRQAFVLGQLAEVLRTQREARAPVKSLEIGWTGTGRLAADEVDQMQAAELKQRQVSRLLADPQDGVAAQIAGLLHELRSNRIENPEVVGRMNELLAAIRQISGEQLPPIQTRLIDALKTARETLRAAADAEGQAAAATPPELLAAVENVGSGQDEVIARLESLVGDFSQWDSYRRFSRELGHLRQAQEELRQDTERTRLDALARNVTDLDGDQRVNLRRLAERQTELGRQFDKVQTRMDQMRAELGTGDPAAETLADALDVARRTAVGGQMRETGRRIEGNQLGDAAQNQQTILRNLQELLDTLANRRVHELESRVSQLQSVLEELQELRAKRQDLQTEADQAATAADPVQRPRELERLQAAAGELAEPIKRLSRRLERLLAEQAAQSLAGAADSLDQTAAAAHQADASQALTAAREAERLLEQAERQLEETRRAAEQELLHEQLERLEQGIAGLTSRQQAALNTTVELEALRGQQEDGWTRAQLSSLGTLAREQRAVGTETVSLADKLAAAPAFALALRGAHREMDRAARGLDRQDAGPATQQAEHSALVRLQHMQEALKREATPAQNGQPQQTPPAQDNQPPPADATGRLAELKLLKLMQQEIRRRTGELEAARQRAGTLTDEQQLSVRQLAEEQGRLAALIGELSGQRDEADGGPERKPDD
jgi:hypothetical protein